MQGSRNKKKNKTTSVYRLFYVKRSAFTAVKRDTKFYKQYKQLYVEEAPFVTDRRYAKGDLFRQKLYIKAGKGLDFVEFSFCFHCGLHEIFQAFWPV